MYDLFVVVYKFVCLICYIPYGPIYYICLTEYYHGFSPLGDNMSYKEIGSPY